MSEFETFLKRLVEASQMPEEPHPAEAKWDALMNTDVRQELKPSPTSATASRSAQPVTRFPALLLDL
jgi:hypothetical protein